MERLYDAAVLTVRSRGGVPCDHTDHIDNTDKTDHTAQTVRARRRPVTLLGVAAALVVGVFASLPAVAGAATSSRLPGLPSTQKPWWTYLPGMGSRTTLPGLGGLTGTLPGLGGSTGTTPVSTAPSTALPGTLTSQSYTNSSGTLAYELYVPSTYKAGTPMPLVVALHGCTETADVMRQLTGWDQLAEQKGFIVLFPQQSSSNNSFECWNFFQSADMSRGSGEPAVIAGMTQMVQQQYSVDPARTYVAGFSAGGAMSSVMAATYPDIYAAAGIGSGCEYAATATCAGYQSANPTSAAQSAYSAMGSYARVMPIVDFQGDQDTTVPPVNATQLIQQWQTTDGMVAKTTMPTTPTSVSNGTSPGGQTYTVTEYGDGQGHELIQAWVVHGMNHAWSGGSSSEQYSDPSGPDETAAMYAFFVNHPMN
jgi:poly(hydroxyalkanoate) depolymerase family esterase